MTLQSEFKFHLKTSLIIIFCALQGTVCAQELTTTGNRNVLSISCTPAILNKDYTATSMSELPPDVTYYKIPYIKNYSIIMAGCQIAYDYYAHLSETSPAFISFGGGICFSKISKQLIENHIFYQNVVSSTQLVFPLMFGYDFLCKDKVLISPSTGASAMYYLIYEDSYLQKGESRYLFDKILQEKDGLVKLQYGLRAGVDFTGKNITFGLYYTRNLNTLFDSMASDATNRVYGVRGNISSFQAKFGFVFSSWRDI